MCCGHWSSLHFPSERCSCGCVKVKDFRWAVTNGEKDHIKLFCWDRGAANVLVFLTKPAFIALCSGYSNTEGSGLPCRSSLMVGA